MKNYAYVDEESCYFKMSPEYMEMMEAELDISIRPFYECDIDSYPVAVLIRYKKSRLKNPIILIEMIELLALLKISFCSVIDRRILIEKVYTEKYNYQITCINLDMLCY